MQQKQVKRQSAKGKSEKQEAHPEFDVGALSAGEARLGVR
jgi:hypothetical protein